MSICCDRTTRVEFSKEWVKPYLFPKDHGCFQDVTGILSRVEVYGSRLVGEGISRMEGTRGVYSIVAQTSLLLKVSYSPSFGGWQDETTNWKFGAPGHRYNNLFRVPYGRQIEQILRDKKIPFGVVREYLAPIGPERDKPTVFDYVVVSEKMEFENPNDSQMASVSKISDWNKQYIREWPSEVRIEFFRKLCTVIREAGYIDARLQNFCFHKTETMELSKKKVKKLYFVDLQPYAVMTERSDNLLSPGSLGKESISRFSRRQTGYAGLYTLFKECQYHQFGGDVQEVVTLYLQKAHKRLEPSRCSRILSIFCCCCCFSRKKNPEAKPLLEEPEL